MKFQRVSSEDCRTPVRGQAVKQCAEFQSALHAPNDVVEKVPVRSCRECHQKTTEHQFVDRQWSRVPRCGLRWSSSQQHSHAVRAVRPSRTKSTFCRQSSIRLHSAHTGSILPTTLWRKSPCEVAEESVIRRLQNTISWTDSEAECRGCGLRWSSSQQDSHAVRAVWPTRTKSTFCRQSSIRLHSAPNAPVSRSIVPSSRREGDCS